ncbi:acyloxyacyl hydrolase [Microbulbifer thermotolerans]|uniref:Acyloxyacyl hydrolase n=1 Tax=Microbulbifer thermotolerans TaxID=252514 RepID=A0AB35HYE9_MICTH|nr:acyloxyacyl hydrolase [Microbulbifer thermotolerans]MCX2780019.1 acyloxyacyl hydrolase [Microbulbifer thermotolerans]MCX2795125.1 acyloxyacyl hydrolase [Microbulbifer thermotolerans]MCX2801846.1 acyloxyacyl hydrolase [Microbulbifer thermotolerans]MCX2805442.1 acyloxyacyl hydrolase [Microbulbifer thermotolerans]MCX2834508.1 acyloxyacyl hydrolase [Microbulbifer thermotolerans]
MSSPPALAERELILSAGKGLGDALIQQDSIADAEMAGLNYAQLFSEHSFGSGQWQWWAQGSYAFLHQDYRGETQQQNIIELKPVLRWYPRQEAYGLFGEFGIGAAYLTNKDFGDIHLSTKLNFALHFAAGYRLRNGYILSLRYSHFSNAYTNTPNPGFDFASLNGHFSF